MTLLRRLALVTGLVLGSTLNAATPVNQVVSENAGLIISIHDAPSLLEKWDKSPWAKTWNDEQVKKFFAPLRAQMKIDEWNSIVKEKSGYTLDELLSFATGDAIFAVTDLDFNSSEAKEPTIFFGVEVGDNQSKIESLLVKDAKENGRSEEVTEFSGVTIHTLQPKEGKDEKATVWAVYEGKWLISQSKDAVVAGIDAIKSGGAANAWGRSERFARLRERAKDPHVTVWLNAESIYPAVVKAVEARAAQKTEENPGAGGFDETAVLKAMGFDAWKDLYMTMAIEDDATRTNFGLNFTEAKGLLKMIAYKEGPVEQPKFVPENALTVSSSRFSIKEAYSALEEMLEAFSPDLSKMVQGQIRNFNKQLGIDLKRDLIGSLGDNFVSSLMAAPAGAPLQPGASMPQLITVSLENAQAFTSAIEALKRMGGPEMEKLFVTRDYLGEKLITFQPPEGMQSSTFAYAIAKGHFFLSTGSALPLESALQSLAGDRPSFWSKPEVREALAAIPANASTFEYQNMKGLVSFGIDALGSLASMMAKSDTPPVQIEGEEGEAEPSEDAEPVVTEEEKLPIDPNAKPDPELIAKYWSYGWGYAVREANGIHATGQIIHPK